MARNNRRTASASLPPGPPTGVATGSSSAATQPSSQTQPAASLQATVEDDNEIDVVGETALPITQGLAAAPQPTAAPPPVPPVAPATIPTAPPDFWERVATAVARSYPVGNPPPFPVDSTGVQPTPGADDPDSSDSEVGDSDSGSSSGAAPMAAPAKRKLSKSRDLKYEYPAKYKESFTFQQRDNWRRAMERVFRAAPFSFQDDEQRVVAALSCMEDSLPPEWEQHLQDLPLEEREEAEHSWAAFVIWLNTLGPESADPYMEILDEYLSLKQTADQPPTKLLGQLRTLEDKLEKLPDHFKSGIFQRALLPHIRNQLAVGGLTSEARRSDLVQRASVIWKTTPRTKSSPQSNKRGPQGDTPSGSNKKQKGPGQGSGSGGSQAKDPPLNHRRNPRRKGRGGLSTSSSSTPPSVTCFHCGKQGHYASSCPEKAAGKPPTVRVNMTGIDAAAVGEKTKAKGKGKEAAA
jgi:hypothetical protein